MPILNRPLLLAPLLLLAACGQPVNLAEHDYRLAHPLAVSESQAVLALAAADVPVLTDGRNGRVERFVDDYVRRGHGPVTVAAGAKGPEDQAARDTATRLSAGLIKAGLRPGELAAELVIDDPALPPGQARMSFGMTTVRLPECGYSGVDMTNPGVGNFGCATQRNIGAMLSNPRDLVHAAGSDPGRDAARSVDVSARYRQGNAYWSAPLPALSLQDMGVGQ